jgi:hypothetical protein
MRLKQNILNTLYKYCVYKMGKKVKQSHYRPGDALRVPGG